MADKFCNNKNWYCIPQFIMFMNPPLLPTFELCLFSSVV